MFSGSVGLMSRKPRFSLIQGPVRDRSKTVVWRECRPGKKSLPYRSMSRASIALMKTAQAEALFEAGSLDEAWKVHFERQGVNWRVDAFEVTTRVIE